MKPDPDRKQMPHFGRLRTITVGLLLLVVAVFSLVLALPPPFKSKEPPNLLVLLVDTLRADHLGYHGCPRKTSPRIDALAARSTVFLNHHAQASRTGPSVATLFTGLHCRSHGVVNPLTHYDAIGSLDESQTTLAEILSGHGYECGGFVTNLNVRETYGFGQGFGLYEYLPSKAASDVNLRALAWLRSRSEPFFLYLHYMEPHSPYRAPNPYSDLFVDSDYRGHIDGSHAQLDRIVAGGQRPRAADVEHLTALYDQEIRQIDSLLGELLDNMESLGLLDNTIVVFLSDHGEEFLDHGSALHGYTLYEEQLRVPFLIHDPRRGHGAKIAAVTRHVDVLPTVLDLLGIAVPPAIQGRSLLPWIKGSVPPEANPPIFAETSLRAVKTVRLQSYQEKGWKLIRWEVPETRLELYHLARDPGESTNLIWSQPERAERIRIRMEEFAGSLPAVAGRPIPVTREEAEVLRSLGYLH